MNKDIDFDALFDVETGEKGQEVADPAEATEEGAQGAEEQELADPAEADEDGSSVPDGEISEDGVDTDTDAGESQQQSPAERARFAAARRKAEAQRDAAVKAAREEANREAQRVLDETIASLGIEDPFLGKPIKTKAEYDAYRAAAAEDQRKQMLRRSGMSDQEYREFVDSLPEVQAAKAAAEAAKTAAAKQKVDEQLTEIAKMDPSVKTLQDLAKTENYRKVYDLVKRGYDLEDAYKLANFDALRKTSAEASRQAAMNAAAGKAHMSATASRGVGAVSVPSDVADMYRVFDPEISDAEIQKHYARYAKK